MDAIDKSGFTAGVIAERLSVHVNTIYNWRKGSSLPDIDQVRILASITSHDITWFYGIDSKNGNNSQHRKTEQQKNIEPTVPDQNSDQVARLSAQLDKAQQQIDKAQEHVDRHLSIIERITKAFEKALDDRCTRSDRQPSDRHQGDTTEDIQRGRPQGSIKTAPRIRSRRLHDI